MEYEGYLIHTDEFPDYMIFKNSKDEYFAIRNIHFGKSVRKDGRDLIELLAEVGGNHKAAEEYLKDYGGKIMERLKKWIDQNALSVETK